MKNVIVVDYGMGNLRSINKKLHNFNIKSKISENLEDIENADYLILPGVGNFKQAINNLKSYGIYSILNQKVMKEKTPIFGICLGMQLFTNFSQEGDCEGFGWIDAETKLIDKNIINDKVPHIGWKNVRIHKDFHIFKKLDLKHKFYFVHSYYVDCNNSKDIVCTTNYSGLNFVSSFINQNIFGVQFHPEKSHKIGMELFNSFINHFGVND